jgi:hypothetical protein
VEAVEAVEAPGTHFVRFVAIHFTMALAVVMVVFLVLAAGPEEIQAPVQLETEIQAGRELAIRRVPQAIQVLLAMLLQGCAEHFQVGPLVMEAQAGPVGPVGLVAAVEIAGYLLALLTVVLVTVTVVGAAILEVREVVETQTRLHIQAGAVGPD